MNKKYQSYGITDFINDPRYDSITLDCKHPKLIRVNDNGYEEIFLEEENEWVLTHRYIMTRILGNNPQPYQEVHHKDRNKRNNHPGNLDIMSRRDHRKLHN